MIYLNYNGKLFKEGSPLIAADNRGLRYGDGLFETMKFLNGKLLNEDEHFSRLWKGLKVLEFEIPKHFTTELLHQQITELVKKNAHELAARIRLTIIRGEGGLYDVKTYKPSYIIQSWPLPPGNGEWNSNGLVLGIYDAAKKSCDILSNLKHNNYLVYVMAALAAKKEKWNDAIVLNTAGHLCDSTIANIFIIKDHTVFTPSLNEGCVAGVTRKLLIKYLQSINFAIVEKSLTVAELLSADEVFLTNSMYNIRWAQRVDGISYSNIQTQQIFAGFIKTIS